VELRHGVAVREQPPGVKPLQRAVLERFALLDILRQRRVALRGSYILLNARHYDHLRQRNDHGCCSATRVAASSGLSTSFPRSCAARAISSSVIVRPSTRAADRTAPTAAFVVLIDSRP
jgi:hypothetical protein